MAAIGAYIFSVSLTALISAVIHGILKESSTEKTVKFVCNIALLLTVLAPVGRLNLNRMHETGIPVFPNGEGLVIEGKEVSRNAVAEIIKQKVESYILDKAAALGAAVTVEVTLCRDDPPVPEYVEIFGEISPYIKLRLEELIQEELNIAKENQRWTG